MGRAPCCEKIGLKRGRWTAEEDQILRNYIHTHGEGSWRSLPKNAGLLRCGKSCRLRWINYLRSDVKRGNITPQEEDLIVKLHSTMGNRWSLIASHLPGRTDNEIKNYWNSHLSRKIHYFTNPVITSTPNQPLTTDQSTAVKTTNVLSPLPKRRRCGRTSRATMKKNRESFTIPKRTRDESTALHGATVNANHTIENDPNGFTDMLLSEPLWFDDIMQMGPRESNLDWEWDRLYDQLMMEDDYDQLWRSIEEEGSTGSAEHQIMPWPMCEINDENRFEESAEKQEATVAWLMS